MCEICGFTNCHPRCENYNSEKSQHYCSFCGEPIYVGDEYIENDNGNFAHFDCIYGLRNLLEWLGYDVKTMEELDE